MYVPLTSKMQIGRSRLEPGNVNGQPWSQCLGKDFRLSPVFNVWNKNLKDLCKHLFGF
jgi:hypothetical protein